MEKEADEMLVKRSLVGDSTAFGLLVLGYQPDICRLVQRLLRSPDDIEDLAQETFVEAYTNLSTIEGRLYRARQQLKDVLTMAKQTKSQAEIQSKLEDLQNQFDTFQKYVQDVAGESDCSLGAQKNQAV